MDNAVVVIDRRLDQSLAGGKRGELVTTVIPMQNRHGKTFKSLAWGIAGYQCGSTRPRDTGKQEVDQPYKQLRIVICPGDDLGKLPEDLDPLLRVPKGEFLQVISRKGPFQGRLNLLERGFQAAVCNGKRRLTNDKVLPQLVLRFRCPGDARMRDIPRVSGPQGGWPETLV